jgi:NAD(P)-dependent dehydrogenase (short-subunit alcohol dehydrogenase family)
MITLHGQRIVLIGASSGIGLATATLAAQRGAVIVMAARGEERLRAAASKVEGETEVHCLDATVEAQVKSFFAGLGAFDHLCTLVPSASSRTQSATYSSFLDTDADLFAGVFRNRFWAQCFAARHGARHLRPGGSIVFVSNTMPRKVIPSYSAACAAAGALEALARILALELAPVRVNVIAPGFVGTPGTKLIPEQRKETWDRLVTGQPVNRYGDAAEIGEAILSLMSNRYATGAILTIDGGYSLT